MLKKISITVLIVLFIIFAVFFRPEDKEHKVLRVISPTEIVLSGEEIFKLNDIETFDSSFSEKNRILASKMNLSENEAFIIGNLAKYWTSHVLLSRSVKKCGNDLIYLKFSYRTKFKNSAFCLENGKPANEAAFSRLLNTVRKGNYIIIQNETPYPISKEAAQDNFVVVRRSHYNKAFKIPKRKNAEIIAAKQTLLPYLSLDKIKIIVSDSTTKLRPDRNCSSDICKEILSCINNSKNSIDIAIYGYSSTPQIEEALKHAIKRGVKIRLVYDVDSKGENIYPDTFKFVSLIPQNKSDLNSTMVSNTMHNKFYIFDKQIVITGSANLSHTDMSGYNSNSIIVIDSPKVARIYETEFEQMFGGKFHSDKVSQKDRTFENLKIYFSPQDKAITNGVLPVIRTAKKYIYIPSFIITERRVVEELIKAKNRGVDVKIIVDALNASNKHSKHTVLRNAGVLVKTENYAGKMHSKSMIVDDEYLIIGSMNFSNSGENKNDENLIVLKNPQAARFYKSFFLYQWNKIPDKWLKLSARAEGIDSIGSCSDGIDNNYDGLTDEKDPACYQK